MKINFSKYQGTGNDFVIIDNTQNDIVLSREQIAFICDRKKGIGADGLMLLGNKEGYDFEMTYYNANGLEGSMCGNGGRCLTQFAYDIGLNKKQFKFIAIDGPHESTINEDGWVYLKMSNVNAVEKNIDGDVPFFVLNTGSPHYIEMVDSINNVDVFGLGQMIRFNDRFKSEGINVNFVEQQADKIFVRTYERGVENETLSCGTGVTAAALISGIEKLGEQTIHIETLGGQLAVRFNNKGDQVFENIWLMGPGTFVFSGSITV
ncbi:MAG: diaminopimelate epimerase [Bacteroidetes bacterium]|nr:diaminopimelate epimerase [Bacteroidota bacterium]